MLLLAKNRLLIEDRERTYLTAAASSGSTTLTVAGVDTNAWADNDYVIIGEIGSPTAEVMQLNGAVSDGTSLVVDRSGSSNTRFAHAIGEPVYRIDYNRVEFSRSATDDSSAGAVLTTAEIQPDDEYTRYEDTSNTTGYGFIRFNNQTTNGFSSYSDGVNYEKSGTGSSFDPRTLHALRRRVRKNLDELRPSSKLTDRDIDEALNDKQRDIAHYRLWSFYEGERSFSTVANQFAYSIPLTVHKIHAASCRTQPLIDIPRSQWDLIHWDTDHSSADPSHMGVWNGELRVYPRPSAAATTTTLGAAISSTTATTITVAATSSFLRGDYYRFIVDSEVIYAVASTSTTFTGCRRGMEGTTAATHSNGATVTERDIVYSCHVEPTDLNDTQDRTSIPEPDVLVNGACADLAPGLNKEAKEFLAKYEAGIKKLEAKYSSKQSSQHGRIRDYTEVPGSYGFARLNPNKHPQSITGS